MAYKFSPGRLTPEDRAMWGEPEQCPICEWREADTDLEPIEIRALERDGIEAECACAECEHKLYRSISVLRELFVDRGLTGKEY